MSYFTEVPAVADDVTDNLAVIQDYLDDPDLSVLVLPAGSIRISAAPIIPSGKTLIGLGRCWTVLRPYRIEVGPGIWEHDFDRTVPALMASALDAECIRVAGLSLDCEKMNNGQGDLLRTHGLMFQRAHGFEVEGVGARNVYGYALYHENPTTGAYWNGERGTNGRFINCVVENSQVHYECTGLDGLLIDGSRALPGDGDVALAEAFTFYSSSRNVTVRACTASGNGVMAKPDSTGGDLENISFEHCRFVRTGPGYAFVTAGGNFIDGLNLTGMTIISEQSRAAELSNSRGLITGSRFVSRSSANAAAMVAVNVGPTAQFDFANTVIECETTGSGSNATALLVANPTPFSGGRLEASATLGQAYATSGPVSMDGATMTIPDGRRQAVRAEISGQATIVSDVAGVSSLVNLQLPNAVVDTAKVDFEASIFTPNTMTPPAHATTYTRMFAGDTNVYVRILGDHAGKKLMWRYRERY